MYILIISPAETVYEYQPDATDFLTDRETAIPGLLPRYNNRYTLGYQDSAHFQK